MPALLALFVALLLAAGCGGGSSNKSGSKGGKSHPAITAGKAPSGKPGLVGAGGSPQDTSAGDAAGYQPTGDIVADNGFRPATDGFSFQNYGNDVGPQNMTAANVEDLFGSQVCASGTGADCSLTPEAQAWMDVENQRMAGGHCMGFSVTANEFYEEDDSPTNYGADTPYALQVQGNVDLQSTLAENWTFQDLASVRDQAVTGTPTDVLNELITNLNDATNGELYTITIFKRDGTGGHAVTPFAVEDHGDGTFSILVYDNNFPGITRAIQVDENQDTWGYIGGPDPSDVNEQYEGDASTQSLSLLPTSPGVEIQPCPFCDGSGAGAAGSTTGSVLPKNKRYDQITLSGSPSNHGHLVLKDIKGRRTGFVGGKIINQIPGVQVLQTIMSQTWRIAPEPKYLIPPGADLNVYVDGSGLSKPDKEKISLIGPGLYAQVDNIDLRPGEKNLVEFHGGPDPNFSYRTDSHRFSTPILTSAISEQGNHYAFAVFAAGISGGSRLSMYIDGKSGNMFLDTRGTKGGIAKTGGYAVYGLSVVRVTKQGDSVWTTAKLLIKRGELLLVDYRHLPARGKPLKVFTAAPSGKIHTLQTLQPEKSAKPKP